MGWLKKLVDTVRDNPVTQFAEKIDPLAGALGGTIQEAVDTGWGKPLGNEKSGLDVIGAGPLNQFGIGGDPNKPEDRRVGRIVGTIFAGYGIGAATGGEETGVLQGGAGDDVLEDGFVGLDSDAVTTAIQSAGDEGFSLSNTGDFLAQSTGDELTGAFGGSVGGTLGTAAETGLTVKSAFDYLQKALGIVKTVDSLSQSRQLSSAQLQSLKNGPSASVLRPGQVPGNTLSPGDPNYAAANAYQPPSGSGVGSLLTGGTAGILVLLVIVFLIAKFR